MNDFITYFDFKYMFECLLKVKHRTEEVSKCFHVKDLTFSINEEHLKTIKQAIELRKQINNFSKEVNKVDEFRRRNEDDIDLKSMTAEYCLSLLFYHSSKFNKQIKVKAPAIAEIILKKNEPDFHLERQEDEQIWFDLKSQWIQNKGFNYLTINEKSHQRYYSKNDFYMICLIDKDFQTGNPLVANFFIITKKFFKDNAELVNGEKNRYYKISLDKLIKIGE